MLLDLIEERKSIFPSLLVERLMLAGSVVVLLCYAWLAASSLERKFEAPKSVAGELSWLVKGELRDWSEVQSFKADSSERIRAALVDFARVLPVIGGFRQAPEILIDSDHDERYTIVDERLQISESIAAADGQLFKALVKVWLLQRAGPEYTASLLRIEVVSDMLTAMLTRTDSLDLPGDRGTLEIPGAVNSWLGFAKSYDSSCASPWKSLELRGVCGSSQELSAMSFRPFLDGLISQVFETIPTFHRYDFLRSWSKAIRAQNGGLVAVRRESPKNLLEWRDFLAHELAILVPMAATAAAVEEVAAKAGLRKGVEVSMVIHRAGPEAVVESLQTALPGRVRDSFVVSLAEADGASEQWLVTGRAFGHPASWIKLGADDIAQLETPLFVFQSCRPESLETVVAFPVKSERLLYVEACTGHPSTGWKALLLDGLKGFARTEPDVPFLQLQRSQLALAFLRGQLDSEEPLANFMTKSQAREHPLLGLSTAEWRRDMLAYRVIGAIEAVEWFRSPAAKKL